jgi:D-methionine transport system substrate-binding protein
MKKSTKIFTLLLVAILVVSTFTGCGSKTSDGTTVVKVGIVGDLVDHWNVINDLLKDEGITIEVVQFSDYVTPNKALAAGEIDMNAFQHYAYLNNEIAEYGYDIVAIGETVIGPMRVFSDKITSLDQLQPGDKVALPNDVTNGGRALKILESAGLITVDPAAGYTPSVQDITENPLNLQIIEVDPSTIPALLPDVTIAVINGNYARDSGLDLDSAVYVERVDGTTDNPYINVIAVRTADKDNEIYKKIVDAYHTDAVAKVLIDAYGGTTIPVWDYTYPAD